jgi:hypothetical protein
MLSSLGTNPNLTHILIVSTSLGYIIIINMACGLLAGHEWHLGGCEAYNVLLLRVLCHAQLA